MIEVQATGVEYSVSFGITTWCPHCEHQMSFNNIAPINCEVCHNEFPNIPALLDCMMDRVAYHKTGKTIEMSRRLWQETIVKHILNRCTPFFPGAVD